MRTRERLIQVELDDPTPAPAFLLLRLIDAMGEHPSPHIRELAAEAYELVRMAQ